jgi:hypothetical protein
MALKPIMATPIASAHMRMRDQSPMVTMSATAPMVQKCVRCAMAPKTTASAKLPTAPAAEDLDVDFLHAAILSSAPALPVAAGAARYFSEASRSLPACAASDFG